MKHLNLFIQCLFFILATSICFAAGDSLEPIFDSPPKDLPILKGLMIGYGRIDQNKTEVEIEIIDKNDSRKKPSPENNYWVSSRIENKLLDIKGKRISLFSNQGFACNISVDYFKDSYIGYEIKINLPPICNKGFEKDTAPVKMFIFTYPSVTLDKTSDQKVSTESIQIAKKYVLDELSNKFKKEGYDLNEQILAENLSIIKIGSQLNVSQYFVRNRINMKHLGGNPARRHDYYLYFSFLKVDSKGIVVYFKNDNYGYTSIKSYGDINNDGLVDFLYINGTVALVHENKLYQLWRDQGCWEN